MDPDLEILINEVLDDFFKSSEAKNLFEVITKEREENLPDVNH